MIVKNLTNSPFDLLSLDGFIRLPAFGSIEAEFSDDYLALLRHSLSVEVSKPETKETTLNRGRGRPKKNGADNANHISQ
jgi:hypothetical protein